MGFRFSPSHINKSIKQERGMGDGSPARGLTAGGKVAVADVTGVLQRHKAPGSSRAPDTEHEQGNNQRSTGQQGKALQAPLAVGAVARRWVLFGVGDLWRSKQWQSKQWPASRAGQFAG